MCPLLVHSICRLTDIHLFGSSQIVDKETLQEVETIHAPVVFAVAARFGSVRLLDNMELEPSTWFQIHEQNCILCFGTAGPAFFFALRNWKHHPTLKLGSEMSSLQCIWFKLHQMDLITSDFSSFCFLEAQCTNVVSNWMSVLVQCLIEFF